MSRIFQPSTMKLLSGLLVGSFVLSAAYAKSGAELANVTQSAMTTSSAKPVPVAPATAKATSHDWAARHSLYYKRNWGIDIVGVKPVTSGYMLAFRYRVLDPDKAKMLNDRKSKAYIIDEATGIRLAVPAMENVGELRTGSAPQADRIYFMIFGNPGKLVKSGSRISVVAGNFHVDGLIVD